MAEPPTRRDTADGQLDQLAGEQGSAVARKYLRYGSSPRGAQALVRSGKILALMKGRYNVALSDIKEAAYPALRHRLILNFEAEAEGIRSDTIIEKILAEIPEVASAAAR